MEEQVQPVSAPMFRQSVSIAKLAEALAKAQGEFATVAKDAENPFFSKPGKKASYADMASVIAATRGALSKYGLSVIQSPRSTLAEGQRCVVVSTMLIHSSGEWIADELAVPIEKAFTAQSVGSAVTYARRYALQAFLCVAGEDDDGNAASGKKEETEEDAAAFEKEFDQRTETQQAIGLFQIQGFDEACKRTGKTEDEISAFLGLIGHKRIEHILKSEFQQALKWANTTGKSGTAAAKAILKPANGNLVKSFDHAWPKLWGRAKDLGISQDDVKTYYREVHKVEHGNQLTPLQFKDVCEWLEAVKV